jgi:translation initiation factor 5A
VEKRIEEVSSLKVGGFVIIEGEPCRIVDIKISFPGKHGHAKARIEGIGILDERKRVVVKPGDAKIEVPIIEKKSAQVLWVRESIAQVMNLSTYETFELGIPQELRRKIREGSQIVYWDVMGRKLMKEIR